MRRIGPSILNAITVISLLMCMATASICSFNLTIGGLSPAAVNALPPGTHITTSPQFSADWRGISVVRTRWDIGTWEITGEWIGGIGAPTWFILAVFALLPLARFARRATPAAVLFVQQHSQVARRLRRGLCPGCSYDLTGNVSGVCPECGSAIARVA